MGRDVVDRMINYVTTHSAITSPIPSPTAQPPYPPIPTPPPPPVSTPPPTDTTAPPAPNSLPTNEANERERVRLEELHDQQFIPNYADLDQIIHNWDTAPEDDVPAELLRLCTNSAHELMPPGFPSDYWPYVLDTDKPLLANRYNYFPPARRAEVFALFQSQLYPNICDKRPRQRPYCYGQALSYPQAFFHKDPDHPDRVSGFQMRCNTTHDRPIRSTRSQTYSPVQRRYLTVKTEELITKGYCERSDSAYRAPIMLVVKKTFLKDFMRLHGDSFFEKLHDDTYKTEIGQFYRLTIDLRLLNAITVLDGHPLPNIQDILNQMFGCVHFSAFDIKDAFWSIIVAPHDRHKFAFSTHDELLQWIVVPQGSKGGATFFARVV